MGIKFHSITITSIVMGLILLTYIKFEIKSLLFLTGFFIISIFAVLHNKSEHRKRRFWIFIVPLYLILILFLQNPFLAENLDKGGGSWINESYDMHRTTEYNLDKTNLFSTRIFITSLTGKISSVPSYIICTKINDSDYLELTKFKSSVYLNNDWIINTLYLFQEECIDFNPDYRNILGFYSEYGYDKLDKNNNFNLSTYPNYQTNPFNIIIEIKPYYPGLITSIITFVLGYWAILWLITRIIYIWNNPIH